MVKVHYRGTLLDGTEFDSSTSKEPAEFHQCVSNTEGVQLMKEGAKYRFHIPLNLLMVRSLRNHAKLDAYLDVELLEVVKPEAEASTE